MAFFYRAQVDYVGVQSVGNTMISIDGVRDENTYVGKQYLLDRDLREVLRKWWRDCLLNGLTSF